MQQQRNPEHLPTESTVTGRRFLGLENMHSADTQRKTLCTGLGSRKPSLLSRSGGFEVSEESPSLL